MSAPPDPGGVFFVSGGTLKATTPSYVERSADREFVTHLAAGEFCYVLTSRQMGKSSLMVRAAAQLRAVGVRTAIVDLTAIGEGGESPDAGSAGAWYLGVSRTIVRELGLDVDLGAWWAQHSSLPQQQRFTEFLEDVVLAGTDGPVVILVDEIDSTLRLPFTDDFFAGIRACYNARATKPAFERLTFALLGVASPTDLIKDRTRTPFNIGHRVELQDFSLAEAQKTLAAGLPLAGTAAERAVERIFHWTGGQPYLTQRLCLELIRRLADAPRPLDDPASMVDDLAGAIFLSSEASRDEVHFKYIRDRIRLDRRARRVLKAYGRILRGGRVVARPQSLAHNALKLAGLVRQTVDGLLVCRNRIYDALFDLAWVRQVMPANYWQRAAVGLGLALVGLVVLWAAWLRPMQQRSELIASLTASLRSAEEDVPRLPYARLKRVPGQAEVAERLWLDYWHRRALRLDELVGTLVTLQATNTRPFDDLERTVRGLADTLEGPHVAAVADRQASRLLAVFEDPKETNVFRVSSLGAVLSTLARLTDASAVDRMADRAMQALASPQETDPARIAQFRAVLAAAAGHLPLARIPALADRVVDIIERPRDREILRLSELGGVLAQLAARMDAEPAARVAARGAAVLCLSLEQTSASNVAELSLLGAGLTELLAQINPRDGLELAGRGALAVARAIEDPQQLDSSELAEVERPFALLATRADSASALALAERLLQMLGTRSETNTGRLDALRKTALVAATRVEPPGLARLGEILVPHLGEVEESDVTRLTVIVRTLIGIADRTDPPIASQLVDRGSSGLLRALVELPDLDSYELAALANLVGMLADRADASVGAAIAARGGDALADLMVRLDDLDQEEWSVLGLALANLAQSVASWHHGPPSLTELGAVEATLDGLSPELRYDAEDLATLGRALARLADRSSREDRERLTGRGAALLAWVMEHLYADSAYDLEELGPALAMLVNRTHLDLGTDLAGRGAATLAASLRTSVNGELPEPSDVCEVLIRLAHRLTPEAAARLAQDLANQMTSLPDRETTRVADFGRALAAVTARAEPQAAHAAAATGVAKLAQALADPAEEDSYRLAQVVEALETLAARVEAPKLGGAAARVCGALESPLETNPARLDSLVAALTSLTDHLDSPTSATLATGLANAMERSGETAAFRLARLGKGLAALVGRVETSVGNSLASRGATALNARLKEPTVTNVVALAQLADSLATLVTRLETNNAGRVASESIRALSSKETYEESDEQSRLVGSRLTDAVRDLAYWLTPREAATVAQQIEASLQDDSSDRQRRGRLEAAWPGAANRLDPRDAGRIARRLTASLCRFDEVDRVRLSRLRSALSEIAPRLDSRDAGRLAVQLTQAMEDPRESDPDRLGHLGGGLAAVVPRMEHEAATSVASRGSAVLVRTLDHSARTSLASDMASTLLTLASRMKPADTTNVVTLFRQRFERNEQGRWRTVWSLDAADWAAFKRLMPAQDLARIGTLVAAGLDDWRTTDDEEMLSLGFWFTDSMGADASARVARGIATRIEVALGRSAGGESSTDTGEDSALLQWWVFPHLEPDHAARLARLARAVFTMSLDELEWDDPDLEEFLGLGLGAVVVSPYLPPEEASRVARWAALLCVHGFEQTLTSEDPEEQVPLIWGVAMSSVWMESDQGEALAARILPMAHPLVVGDDPGTVLFAEMAHGLALASLSARLPSDAAADFSRLAIGLLTKPTGLRRPDLEDRAVLLARMLEELDPFRPMLAAPVIEPLIRNWLDAIEKLKLRAPEAANELEKHAALFRARLPAQP